MKFIFIVTLLILNVDTFAENKVSPCPALTYPISVDGYLNWEKIGSDDTMKICLTEVSSHIQSVDSMVYWLERQGFKTTKVINTPHRVYVNGVWDVQERGRIPFANNLNFLMRFVTKGKNYSVQVVYEKSVSVNVSAHHEIL
jgi:hypothetical protein